MERPHFHPIVKTTDLYRAAAKQLFCFAWNRGGDLEIGEPPLKDTSAQNYGRPNSSFKDTQAAKSLVYGRKNVLESEKQYCATCLHPSLCPYLHGM